MLSPADADIVSRDPALPGLAFVLDEQAVSDWLGRKVTSIHLRYKPGVSCVATFRDGTGFLTFRALPPDRFSFEVSREPNLPSYSPLCLRILRPENDRRLKPLRHKTLAELAGRGDSAVRLLRYKPERRLVGALPDAVVKLIAPSGWSAAYRGSMFGATQAGPRVLLADTKQRVLVSEWITGAAPDRTCPETGYAIGKALAHLHKTDPGDLYPQPLRVPAALEELGRLYPLLKSRADMLALRLAANFQIGKVVPCHGDFNADQVIVSSDGTITFVDWDEARLDDPAADLATFMARSYVDHLDDPALATADNDQTDALLSGYGTIPDTLSIRHAAALAALVTEPFRMRVPDWPIRSIRILDRAEELIPETVEPLGLARQAKVVEHLTGITAQKAEVLREKKGRRILLRYGDAIGKQRIKGYDAHTPALHNRLRSAGFSDGEVAVPAVLAEAPALNMWIQQRISAPLLTDLLPTTDHVLHAVGRSLARLHHSAVTSERRWTMVQEAAVMTTALNIAMHDRPNDASDIRYLMSTLQYALSDLEPAPDVLLHRDFYPDQVLVDDQQIWLLDLDLCAQGAAVIDIGNFLAHLDEWALRTGQPVNEAPFLHGYATIAVLPEGIELLRSVSLARHIHIAQRFPDRQHEPALILEHLMAKYGSIEHTA